jgi:hypothetical protein
MRAQPGAGAAIEPPMTVALSKAHSCATMRLSGASPINHETWDYKHQASAH